MPPGSWSRSGIPCLRWACDLAFRSTTPNVSARMRKQARRDTGPELQLRSALHRRGYRFRVNYPVPGLPRRSIDIAFTKMRVAVFVDGCFWHACPVHAIWPRANAAWWRQSCRAMRNATETRMPSLSHRDG